MNKNVIYTAIFGNYDELPEPLSLPKGWDFICFTDSDIKSDTWQIKKVSSLYKDTTRTARKYKILPHRFLQDYDRSIWIDGNFLIKDDLNLLWDQYMKDDNLVVYSHMHCFDKRNCIYEEAQAIEWLFNVNKSPNKQPKDDLNIIKDQMEKYIKEGYPSNNGLIISGILLRNHNVKSIVDIMETWWEELRYGSKRDQLSFNYACWKNDFDVNYINDDIRDNKFFKLLKHNKHK